MVTRQLRWAAVLFITYWAGASAPAHASGQPTSIASPTDKVSELQKRAENLLLRSRITPDERTVQQADATVHRALKMDRRNPKSWELLAWSEMSHHRFLEALTALDHAQSLGQNGVIGLGLRADALVELGRYPEALVTVQEMLDRFPGLPAFSRAAHLRFLHGDTEGAISLMQKAVLAGRPRSEEIAWVLLQLSELQLHARRFSEAEQTALLAGDNDQKLATVHAQLGRVKIAQGQFDEAINAYEHAWQIQPNPEYAIALHDLAERMNRPNEVRRQSRLIDAMARLDEVNGNMNRRAFANHFANQKGGAKRALRLAREEARARPDIYSEDTMAWAFYRLGQKSKAVIHMERALALGSHDLTLLEHGAIIFETAGDTSRAASLRTLQQSAVSP